MIRVVFVRGSMAQRDEDISHQANQRTLLRPYPYVPIPITIPILTSTSTSVYLPIYLVPTTY